MKFILVWLLKIYFADFFFFFSDLRKQFSIPENVYHSSSPSKNFLE